MTHVVTGGAGFIGSHLTGLLAQRGERVRVIDNLSRGKMGNLHDAMLQGQVSVLRRNLAHVESEFNHQDTVWHLAAKVTGIEYNRHHQYEMLAENLIINFSVIEAVKFYRPRLFVYVSTACIYPHDAPVPTPESAGNIGNPEETNHGYGVAKWVGEQMIKHLCREHGIPCIIARFFNAFGPRDYYDKETSHVAPALIRRVMEGENPVVVWGTGNQTRALVDARDIAQALLMLSQCKEAYSAEPVNIGHEREISMRELVETIIGLSGREPAPELLFDTSKPDGYPRRAADTLRLRNLIGWVPDRPLEETLHDMIEEFRAGKAHL